jgi:hypothetical protein
MIGDAFVEHLGNVDNRSRSASDMRSATHARFSRQYARLQDAKRAGDADANVYDDGR